jgi:hypothetical protein
MCADHFQAAVLRQHGAGGAVLDELLDYTANAFTRKQPVSDGPFPLPDEPFVDTWTQYLESARREGVFNCIRERLLQLRFPIAEGMSRDAAYLLATRRGVFSDAQTGLRLARPDALELRIHATPAGHIPVLIAGARPDFVRLVQALTCRNEPAPIPMSMGAVMVAGYNNWDRVRALRQAWEANRSGAGVTDWTSAFREMATRKELYQDRFIILSTGPYSGITAEQLGLSEAAWLDCSLRIRLEHECAHYFTRRVFGTMRNSLHDELIADFVGMRAATGEFRADWQLRFFGLEWKGYRAGGRLENYRGQPALSDAAFIVLQRMVRLAALNLEAINRSGAAGAQTVHDKARTIMTLANLSLPELACDQALRRFRRVHKVVHAHESDTRGRTQLHNPFPGKSDGQSAVVHIPDRE